jgi:thioredoxin 2
MCDSREHNMNLHTTPFIIHCPGCGMANRVPAASEGRAGKCGSCHAVLPPLYTKAVALTDRNFDSFVESYPGPVMVEFWAAW